MVVCSVIRKLYKIAQYAENLRLQRYFFNAEKISFELQQNVNLVLKTNVLILHKTPSPGSSENSLWPGVRDIKIEADDGK